MHLELMSRQSLLMVALVNPQYVFGAELGVLGLKQGQVQFVQNLFYLIQLHPLNP